MVDGSGRSLRHAATVAATTAGLTAAMACSDGTVPLESFCNRWANAVCIAASRCQCVPGGDAFDPVACEAAAVPHCPLARDSAPRMALQEGTLVYDPTDAARYLQRLEETSCDGTDYERDATLGDLATRFGTLDGTRTPGEACMPGSAIDACADGMCDPERGVCFGLAGAGEPCDELHACDQPVSGDREQRLFCADDSTCRPLRERGQSCAEGYHCRSGRCGADGRCIAKEPNGAACEQDVQCDSGRCDFSTGRCRPLEMDGRLCSAHADCASGWCEDVGGETAGTCTEPKANGEECRTDVACRSGHCPDGTCRAAACELLPPLRTGTMM